MSNKYYFENSIVETKFPTLWHGYFLYKNNMNDENNINNKTKLLLNTSILSNISEIDNILVEICNINFYISILDNYIHLSLCRDENYYCHDFEKHIKIIIKSIEDKLNIFIYEGSFDANEVKHNGNQYRYSISKVEDSIILKKKTLNWDLYENKKKIVKIKDSMKNLKIG